MAKQKRNGSMKEQMEGIAIAITPVKVEKKRDKKMGGGKTMKPAKTRYTYNEGSEVNPNKGIEALRKEAPEVVARMGYQEGSEVKPSTEMYYDTDGNLQKFDVDPYKAIGHTVVEDKGRFDFQDKDSPERIGQRVERINIENTIFKPYEDKREGFKGAKSITTGKTTTSVKSELPHMQHVAAHLQNMLLSGNILDLKELFKREKKQEGGDVDSQMAMMMPIEEAPMPIEQEQDMMPDEQMEDEYLDFIIDQSLSPEEETSLMSKLEADPELSVMFDKVMDTATEFAGAGPVDGPGSGVSDSIPARLSDGEFVFTAKATEQIGADRLQSMMEDAEMEADAMRQEMQEGGAVEEKPKVDRFGKPVDEDIAEDEIKKGMMSVNPRMQ